MGDSVHRHRHEPATAQSGLRDSFKQAALERLSLIESATIAVRFGRLDEDLRARATRAAHKIADGARMFGYWDAAELALEIQAGFEGTAPIPSIVLSRLFEIASQLRRQFE